MKTLKRVPYRGYAVHQNQGPAGIWFAVRHNKQTIFQAPTFEACMNFVDARLADKPVVKPRTTSALLADLGKELGRMVRADLKRDKGETMKSKKEVKKAQAKKNARKGHTLPSEPTGNFKLGQPVAVIVGGKPVPGFEYVDMRGKFFIVKNTKKGTEHRVWLNKLQAA